MKRAILFLIFFTLNGCDQSAEVTAESVATVQEADSQTGMVLETIDVDGYTYIRLDQAGQEVWLAGTPLVVSKGEFVRYSGEMMMQDFHSKTLDRTFPTILFVSKVQRVAEGTETLSNELASAPDVASMHKNMASVAVTEIEPVSVEPLEGGKTIAEIFAENEQIVGQKVSLRAQVVKFSANILGKNWITLQDGTGTAPDDKLVVTSSETVAVGDELIVSGLVKTNVDIGAGYNYKVLLEEAGFSQ